MRVPLTVAARNEERALGPCLDALLVSVEHARRASGVELEVLVVLDDCTDRTGEVARSRGVRTVPSSGGKVEAQRTGLRAGPFAVFVDADVLVTPPTLAALTEAMITRPEVVVAFPPKAPLPPISRGRLARALHVYNRERGFSSQRTWFSGKCFAMRGWSIPTAQEMAPRIARLPADPFLDLAAGMRVDDVYLSRRVVAEHGTSALLETADGCVHFRAPETLRGMYLYYRRMRTELDRVSRLFPELDAAHEAYGARRADRLAQASARDRARHVEFELALALCRARYRLERAYYRHLARAPCPVWPPIEETKCSLGTAIPG